MALYITECSESCVTSAFMAMCCLESHFITYRYKEIIFSLLKLKKLSESLVLKYLYETKLSDERREVKLIQSIFALLSGSIPSR